MTELPIEFTFAQDAEDRRAALAAAVTLADDGADFDPHPGHHLLRHADAFYAWLRDRRTLHAVSLILLPGTPSKEGTTTMTASINLEDDEQVAFTLAGEDSKGVQVDAPADTWSWTLSDPDSSGAVLTVSGDTTSATVAAGTPTVNLSLSVVGQDSGITGAEAIIVTAGPAVTVDLVPGTPAPE